MVLFASAHMEENMIVILYTKSEDGTNMVPVKEIDREEFLDQWKLTDEWVSLPPLPGEKEKEFVKVVKGDQVYYKRMS